MSDFQIDPEFRAQLSPLPSDKRDELERLVLEHGMLHALVVGVIGGSRLLVDGHNRYEIAQKHGLDFDVIEIEFASREDAADWIDRNQFGRREMTSKERDIVAHRIYERSVQRQGAYQQKRHSDVFGSDFAKATNNVTSKKVAKELGVSQSTVDRAVRMGRAVNVLREVDPQLAEAAMEESVSRSAVVAAAKVARDDPGEAKTILCPSRDAKKESPAGPRKFNGVPVDEMVVRFATSIYTASQRLSEADVSSLVGTEKATEIVGQLRRARTWLRALLARLEGR